ncbi:DUF397 domain-containing protein [Streptomyces sp. uw30]|uniref:DUF397 domain-containing protein n=1 Tax=Streptomyces sp. uw30 TaxID=1828179 RepID=UPI0011CE4488|nr:DUF397 domain-containing protein [Streptomyces sp. uw30]TXS41333.1 DUF397 domain-containing protein [Streptomyces sp. uw30]
MSELRWTKSSYSPDASNCVEIATTPTTIHIRDSKNPNGPYLTLRSTTWASFHAHAIAARR